ncbi:MAG: hypothetical protein AB7F50_06000 [Fimbriimonadaceae bacterium]
MLTFLAIAIGVKRLAQDCIAWGVPNEGLALGFAETRLPHGPPLFRTYVRNETGAPVALCTGTSLEGPSVPVLEFRESFRVRKHPFLFTVTPPRGQYGAGGLVVGVPSFIQIEPGQTVLLHRARFWIPGKPGLYGVRASFVQPTHTAYDWHPTFRAGGLVLASGVRYVTIFPSDRIESQDG